MRSGPARHDGTGLQILEERLDADALFHRHQRPEISIVKAGTDRRALEDAGDPVDDLPASAASWNGAGRRRCRRGAQRPRTAHAAL